MDQDPMTLVQQAVASDPELGLGAVRVLRGLVDRWEETQVRNARQRGWNWAEIAKVLGRHRQAVHREYAAKT